MAGTITTALSNAFKVELLKGTHDFDTSGGSISYQGTATDTDTAGIFLGEFEMVIRLDCLTSALLGQI